MTNEWTALHTFWNSFGIPAYDENTVPDGAQLPYITYEAQISGLDDQVSLSASLWYRSMSWAEISEKAHEISRSIGGGTGVGYSDGRLWITKASPFAQRMSEPSDEQVRRILLQIAAEFQ